MTYVAIRQAIRKYLAGKAYRLWLKLDPAAAVIPTYPLQSFRETRDLWGRVKFDHNENQLAVDGHWYRYLTEQTALESKFVTAARIFHTHKSRSGHIGIRAADEAMR